MAPLAGIPVTLPLARALALALALALAFGAAHAQTAAPVQTTPAPQLEPRTNSAIEQPLDARITAPVTIPTEAWGHYTFGRELNILEVDLEKRGLNGYLTLLVRKGPDRNSPLTFFFSQTRVGGDTVYFATQQIHRQWYEFHGTLEQAPPHDHSLEVEYSLVGTLTEHSLDESGSDKPRNRSVTFRKVSQHLH